MQKEQTKTSKADINNYILDTQIGHGASGVCYKAISKTDKSVCAIKKISVNTIKGNSLKLALKEVEILKNLNHPNIIKYYDSFVDDNYLYIAMEYAQKGDLHAIVKRRKIKQQFYNQFEVWEMGKQLLEALKYLHSKNIVHRDFKTLNIFIGHKNNLLVGDLGVSKILKNDVGLYSRVGTPLYLAPEIIKYQKYDFKADIWGFGCVMYIIASLSHPFQGKNIINLGQNIIHSDPKSIPNFSDQFNNFIKMCLQKNPALRPDAKTLLSIFYTNEAQILRNPQPISTKKLNSNPVIKTQPKIQHHYKQKIQNKLNCFFQGQSGKLQPKTVKGQKSDMELNQNRNIIKGIDSIPSTRMKEDETIVFHQGQMLKAADGPQQKTRIRAFFTNKNRNSIKKQAESSNILSASIECQSPRIFVNLNKNHISPRRFPEPKIHSQSFQRQSFQRVSQKLGQEGLLKIRNIQSAKLKPAVVLVDKQLGMSLQGMNKQKSVFSINRGFFESCQKASKKMQPRPKSSIGRRGIISNNQLKYIKKRKTVMQQDISQTKTQLLRKPEVIII